MATTDTIATAPRFAPLARAGYAARGVIYLIIGGLAVRAAFGSGGQTTDAKGALQQILEAPFGQVLLGIVAIGLFGYAAWRFVQSLADTDDHGTGAKGLAVRGGLFVSAITHILLAIFALSLVFGWGSGGGGGESGGGTQHWTSMLMQQPYGRWLVALIGVAVIGAGIAHIVKGVKAKFERFLEMSRPMLDKVRPICRFGLIARGVVFLIVGGFFIVAAWQFSAEEAKGLQGALQALQQAPYGWILFAIVALGLFAFGIYGLVEARYRRIDEPGG